jgi:hypothetical protein
LNFRAFLATLWAEIKSQHSLSIMPISPCLTRLAAESHCRETSEVIFRFDEWKMLVFPFSSRALRFSEQSCVSIPVVPATAVGLEMSLEELVINF